MAEERNRFRQFVAHGGYVNQKRLDTLQLLARLGGHIGARARPAPATPRTSFLVKLHYDIACRPVDVPDGDLPLDERIALEADRLGRLSPLLRRLAQLMAMVHALGDDAGDDFARRHGKRATKRLHRRHMLDLLRLDGAYRRLLPACELEAEAGGTPRAGRRNRVEIGIYRQLATLWAIVEERIALAGVDFAESLQTFSDEFRRARGLERRTATLAWRRANGLDRRGYERLVVMDARLALVSAGAEGYALTLAPATNPAFWLIDAIRLAGLSTRLEKRVLRGASARGHAPGGRTAA